MSGRGLAAFAAGFGTGYLNQQRSEQEQKRQERKDKMAQEEHDLRMRTLKREEDAADRTDKLNSDISAIQRDTYGVKRAMTPDDVRGMMGGSSDPNAENYVSDEAAATYLKNNTGTDQVTRNAAYFAQQGVGNKLDGMKPIRGDNGETQLADESTKRARPTWKILEQAAKMRIGSGIPQQEQLGYQALAYAQTLKSQEARDGAVKAYQGGGLEGVMKFMSDWDNEDYPVTNIRMDTGAGGYDPTGKKGTVKFLGDINGKTVTLKSYDLSKLPEGQSIDDAVMNDVQALTDPKAMFDIRAQQLQMRRKDLEDQRAQGNVDRAMEYTKGRDATKDEQFNKEFNLKKQVEGEKLGIERAGLTLKQKELELGGKNVPSDVQTAKWLMSSGVAKDEKEAWDMVKTTRSASPEAAIQQLAVNLRTKDTTGKYDDDPKVLARDARAIYEEINKAPQPQGAPPANRPPLSSFNR